MKKSLLFLTLLLINVNTFAYDTAVPFTSGYFTMCTKAEYLDTRYYEHKARESCRPLPILNFEVVEYKDNKAKITYKGKWTAWVYRSALVINHQ